MMVAVAKVPCAWRGGGVLNRAGSSGPGQPDVRSPLQAAC